MAKTGSWLANYRNYKVKEVTAAMDNQEIKF